MGCGKHDQAQNLGNYSALVNQFVSDSQAHGKQVDIGSLVIQVQALPTTSTPVTGGTEISTTEGECTMTMNGPVVTISQNAVNTYDTESFEALMYHELGHCLLGRVHNPATESNGNPVSIMYPAAVVGTVYYAARTQYLNELFNE
jgi:hypothetical protein